MRSRLPALVLASVPLLVVGGVSCLVWHKALLHYRRLIDWRYKQLMAIEQSDSMLGSHRLYSREWNEYDESIRTRGFRFSALESSLPKLFLLLYAAYVVGLAVMLSRVMTLSQAESNPRQMQSRGRSFHMV